MLLPCEEVKEEEKPLLPSWETQTISKSRTKLILGARLSEVYMDSHFL